MTHAVNDRSVEFALMLARYDDGINDVLVFWTLSRKIYELKLSYFWSVRTKLTEEKQLKTGETVELY